MNRKDDKKRYQIKNVSEDGEVCDNRYMEYGAFTQWTIKEIEGLKNLLQGLMELAVQHGK